MKYNFVYSLIILKKLFCKNHQALILIHIYGTNEVYSADDNRPVLTDNEVEHLTTLPEEEAVVALMGYPRPGEITRAQLRIKESKEFKVSLI